MATNNESIKKFINEELARLTDSLWEVKRASLPVQKPETLQDRIIQLRLLNRKNSIEDVPNAKTFFLLAEINGGDVEKAGERFAKLKSKMSEDEIDLYTKVIVELALKLNTEDNSWIGEVKSWPADFAKFMVDNGFPTKLLTPTAIESVQNLTLAGLMKQKTLLKTIAFVQEAVNKGVLKPEVGRNRIHWKLEDPVVLQSPPSRDDVIKTLDIADPQTLGPELYQKVLFMGISRLKVEGDDKLAEVWVEKLGEFRNRA